MAKKTSKELHKLRRQDLLELLNEQSREVAKLHETIDGLEEKTAKLSEENERLSKKLEERDAQLKLLLKSVGEKEEVIRVLEKGGRIAGEQEGGATVRLDELFLVLKTAGEAYLRKKTRQVREETAGKDDL